MYSEQTDSSPRPFKDLKIWRTPSSVVPMLDVVLPVRLTPLLTASSDFTQIFGSPFFIFWVS